MKIRNAGIDRWLGRKQDSRVFQTEEVYKNGFKFPSDSDGHMLFSSSFLAIFFMSGSHFPLFMHIVFILINHYLLNCLDISPSAFRFLLVLRFFREVFSKYKRHSLICSFTFLAHSTLFSLLQ